MKINNTNLLFFLILSFLLPVAVFSQTFAVVDVQEVMTKSKPGIEAMTKLEASLKSLRADIKAKQASFATEAKKLKTQSMILSQEALVKKQKSLQSRQKKFFEDSGKKEQSFKKKNTDYISKVSSEMNLVLKEIENENSYSFIIDKDKNLVIYSNDSLDITSEVIKRMNIKKIIFS